MNAIKDILSILNEYYLIHFDRDEMMRDAGSVSYTVFSGNDKYFLRVIKPAFLDTAVMGADIQAFLQNQGFPVPPVIFTKDNLPYVRIDNGLFILLYQEIVMCLSELGYYPRKQRSYIVFKHDLHNKEMAKMGTTWTKDASPCFALRFSACTGYSQKFSNVVKDYIIKNPNKLFPHCENGRCVFSADGDRTPFYEVAFPDGGTQSCCGAKALIIPDITAESIEEIKKLIKEEHNYLVKHEV